MVLIAAFQIHVLDVYALVLGAGQNISKLESNGTGASVVMSRLISVFLFLISTQVNVLPVAGNAMLKNLSA